MGVSSTFGVLSKAVVSNLLIQDPVLHIKSDTSIHSREVKLQTLSYLQVSNWFLVELIESKHQYRF